MAFSKIANGCIRGVVTAVPGDPIPVDQLPVDFPVSEIPKIAKTVGLGSLHRATAAQTAGDLSLEAARVLIDKLGWQPDSIDALVHVTQTGDYFSPATACILHGKLGLAPGCLAFDVNIACSGYVYGLLLAWQFIGSGTAKRVLLTVGDTPGKTVSRGDRSTAILFGDAASATALEYEEGAGEAVFVTGTDGAGVDDLIIPAGAWRRPLDQAALETATDESGNTRAPCHIHMDGLAIFNFTLLRVPEMTRGVAARAGVDLAGVERFYYHQANAFILKTLAAKMGIPREKIPINIGKFGNTSMVSIPLLLTDESSRDFLTAGKHRVVMAGFGAGYSWAAMSAMVGGLKVLDHIAVHGTGHV